MRRIRQKGQGIYEFALCLALAAASISLITIYIRRGLQARYAAAVRYSLQDSPAGHQYEPYYTREKQTEEKTKGETKTAWHTWAGTNMQTEQSGWEHIPLPKRWTTSKK